MVFYLTVSELVRSLIVSKGNSFENGRWMNWLRIISIDGLLSVSYYHDWLVSKAGS
jgi:hypothetical protein